MKKLGFSSIAATAFATVVLGLAAPANADLGHHDWVTNIQQQGSTNAPTSTVGNGR